MDIIDLGLGLAAIGILSSVYDMIVCYDCIDEDESERIKTVLVEEGIPEETIKEFIQDVIAPKIDHIKKVSIDDYDELIRYLDNEVSEEEMIILKSNPSILDQVIRNNGLIESVEELAFRGFTLRPKALRAYIDEIYQEGRITDRENVLFKSLIDDVDESLTDEYKKCDIDEFTESLVFKNGKLVSSSSFDDEKYKECLDVFERRIETMNSINVEMNLILQDIFENIGKKAPEDVLEEEILEKQFKEKEEERLRARKAEEERKRRNEEYIQNLKKKKEEREFKKAEEERIRKNEEYLEKLEREKEKKRIEEERKRDEESKVLMSSRTQPVVSSERTPSNRVSSVVSSERTPSNRASLNQTPSNRSTSSKPTKVSKSSSKVTTTKNKVDSLQEARLQAQRELEQRMADFVDKR